MMLLGVAVASTGINEKWDFRSFYAAGYLMRTQPTQLYDLAQQERVQHAIISNDAFVLPFYHPCYELLLIAPFSFLRYSRAYFAFIAFNMLLLLAIFFAARPTFSSIVPVYQPRPGLMLFIYIPVMLTILFGQDSILLLLLVCIAWRQLEFGNDLIAGCLLALALFKFQIVIPMAALIALQRGWRFLGAFLAAAAGIALVCVGITGTNGTADFVRLLFNAGSAMGKSTSTEVNIGVYPSAMPNIAGLLYAIGGRLLPSARAFNALALLCSLGVFAWCARVVRRCDLTTAVPIAILRGLLVSHHLFIYDLTLVILAVAILGSQTPQYILLAVFGLPIVLLPFWLNSFFLMAIPVLAMLLYTLVTAPRRRPPKLEMAHAL
jgi:Glycosyltransferase family 87